MLCILRVKETSKNNLAQENEKLRKENVRLFAENERLRQEVKLLKEKIDWLMRKMFGSSSEALNSNQLDLFAVLPDHSESASLIDLVYI